jgi:hypothetical protein
MELGALWVWCFKRRKAKSLVKAYGGSLGIGDEPHTTYTPRLLCGELAAPSNEPGPEPLPSLGPVHPHTRDQQYREDRYVES